MNVTYEEVEDKIKPDVTYELRVYIEDEEIYKTVVYSQESLIQSLYKVDIALEDYEKEQDIYERLINGDEDDSDTRRRD